VTDRSLPGLATLRSRAAISIAEREREVTGHFERPAAVAAAATQGGVDAGEVLLVEDVSHDTFLEANEEWERSFTGRMSLDTGRSPLDGEPVADYASTGRGDSAGKRTH